MTKLVYFRSNYNWTRDYCKGKPDWLFLFADNTDRNSGRNLIPENRPYIKKYGPGKHFPNVTTACIRGLENAMPISTQKYYHGPFKGESGRWQDEDLELFCGVIDDEIKEIKKYILEHKPLYVVLPPNGFFNSRISAISVERVPKLFDALKTRLNELQEFIVSLEA